MMLSRLILIRHGITEGNRNRWFYGREDLPLVEEGKTVLNDLRAEGIYPDIPVDADCYTSGMKRADETFGIIYPERDRKVISRLREMDFGDFECQTWDVISRKPGFDEWIEDETGDIPVPGGESRNQFLSRISEGLSELIGYHRLKEWSHRHGGEDAVSVLVCHGGAISGIMQELFPGGKEEFWAWTPEPGHGYIVDFADSDPAAWDVF